MRGGRSSDHQENPVAVTLRAGQMRSERLAKTARHRRPQRPDEGFGLDGEEQSHSGFRSQSLAPFSVGLESARATACLRAVFCIAPFAAENPITIGAAVLPGH